MNGYGNDEQRQAYRDALEVEKAGYEQKVAAAQSVGDSAGVDQYKNRIKQVDAEIANLDGAGPSEDDDVDLSPAEKVAKAKTGAQLDEVAAELGYEFPDDVSKVADKKAALEEYVSA